MALKVISWSLSTDAKYKEMLERNTKTIPEDDLGLKALRNSRAKVAFETLVENNNPDIMCLQQVGSDLEKVKGWLGKDFEILSDGVDTAVAYKKERFESKGSYLSEVSKGRKFTILTLLDKLSEKTHIVASANISSFDLMDPKGSTPSALVGDQELEDLLSKLNEQKGDGTIIGLDTNTTIKHYVSRIEILLHQGFWTFSDDKSSSTPTKYDPDLGERIKTAFIFAQGFKSEAFERLDRLELEDPLTSPSDQIPVIELLQFDEASLEKGKSIAVRNHLLALGLSPSSPAISPEKGSSEILFPEKEEEEASIEKGLKEEEEKEEEEASALPSLKEGEKTPDKGFTPPPIEEEKVELEEEGLGHVSPSSTPPVDEESERAEEEFEKRESMEAEDLSAKKEKMFEEEEEEASSKVDKLKGKGSEKVKESKREKEKAKKTSSCSCLKITAIFVAVLAVTTPLVTNFYSLNK